MTPRRLVPFAALALMLAGAGLSATLLAQTPPTPPTPPRSPSADAPAARPPARPEPPAPAVAPDAPPAPEAPAEPDADAVDEVSFGAQDVVRIGQDFTLAAGEEAQSVVVIMGNAQIDGHAREVVVVMGTLRLGPMARIDRELTSIAGGVTVADGATVGREVVVVAGTLDAPPGFTPGREHVVINPPFLGGRLNNVVPYFTRGLMWGRVIVPSLPWLWGIVALFFLVYLVVNLLAAGPVRATAAVLDEKTLTSFGTGLLVLLLLGPVAFLLAVSVVGVLVIPVVLCALLAAGLIGKVATFRWLGLRVWRGAEDTAAHAAAVFAIGFAIVTVFYMVPVLGVVSFALLSVLGLGAATLSFVAAYRREQPPAPPAPVTPPPIAPPPLDSGTPAGPGAEVPAMPMTEAPPLAAPGAYAVSAFPKGLFRDRLAAFLLDIILVVLVVQVTWPFRDGPRVFFLALLAYHIGFWAWKHTTVGGLICQLRIIRVDGVPLTVSDAFIRGLSAIFSLVVVGLGFLWVLRDPERQSWHDKIAGTYVVKVPRHWRG